MNARGRLEVGDRVSRKCSANHEARHMTLKTGTVTHTGRVNYQVQWDDGMRGKYDPSELVYIPIGKEKKQ